MKISYQVLLCISIASSAHAASYNYTLKVTPEIIAEYQKTIGPFIEKRKKQNGLINTGIGGFFASLSGVNVEEARSYLGRAFENQQALDEALAHLATDQTCVAYIQKIISELSSAAIRRKSSKKLPELMRAYKYPGYNGSAAPWNKQEVSDKEFYNGAACSFMIYHLVESDGPARIKNPVDASKQKGNQYEK